MTGLTGSPTLDTTRYRCVVRAWDAHEHELLAFLLRRASDHDLAHDLLQDVFLKAMREGPAFCALDKPRAWLFQVARNALIDASRRAKPTIDLPDDLSADAPPERAPVDELDTCIARNLPELEIDDRYILEVCDLQGLTVRRFAEANELTLPAAKSRLLRARKRLRDILVKNCQVQFDEGGHVCCHVPRPADT